ncbi:non-specific serine/threonine protein kinase [Ranunculus cassubicifolius]
MASAGHLHLFLLFLLHLIFYTSAQSNHNISMRAPLSSLDKNSYWTSPSGEFAFGFYPHRDLFLLAIWFDKIPLKTIVWTANDGKQVERGATVELTSNGVFSLKSQDGTEIWKTQRTNNAQVAYGVLLNTGNLVLISMNSTVLWASFDSPTDTILPSQILNSGNLLSSRATEKDYTIGRFQLTVQDDGNIVLNTVARPTDDKYTAYWASHTWPVGTQLVFNQSGSVYQNLKNATSRFYLSMNSTGSTAVDYQRVTLDYDGVLRKYIYPKYGRSSPKAWTTLWSIPEDICAAKFDKIGSGVCGFNSYCRLDKNQRPACDCPPSYVYMDPNNKFGGCEPNFAPQACSGAGGDGFRMENLSNTDWPSNEYDYIKSQSEDWCRTTCLKDCLCFAAVIINRTECLFKKYPLSSGRFNSRFNGTTLIKVGNETTLIDGDSLPNHRKKEIKWMVAGFVVLCIAIVFLLLGCYLSCYRKRTLITPKVAHTSGVNLQSFSYMELEDATDGFKEELGRGAVSVVYKGVLESDSGRLVAVKRLDRVVHGNDKEFKAEMSAIGKTNHKNLACLLGFCDEGAHRILVYEYMRNGSLEKSLFKGSSLGWEKRVQIATGIARGLAYLHEDCSSQIIHCDVKPQNILLDDSYVARISDFGLAKLLQCEQSRTSTGIRGTRGYVAPEWFKNMPVTAKVDVYSFGIMLLEIVCCRRNAEQKPGAEDMEILSEIAYGCCEQRALHQLVANDEEAQNDAKTVETLVRVALWCIQEEPSQRPSMKKVTQMLEGVADVSMPKDPCSFTSSTVSDAHMFV